VSTYLYHSDLSYKGLLRLLHSTTFSDLRVAVRLVDMGSVRPSVGTGRRHNHAFNPSFSMWLGDRKKDCEDDRTSILMDL
jgi:hypothetical protein